MKTAPHAQPTWSTVVLAPGDELDIAVVPELRSRLAGAYRPGAQVVLDLHDVTFIDSSALSIVLAADRRLAASGGQLKLAHVSPPVRRVLRICGLADLVLPSPAVGLRRTLCRAAHLN